MNLKLRRLAAAGLLGFSLFAGGFSVSAAPAWSLNQQGVQIQDDKAKQAYIYKEMDAYFKVAVTGAETSQFSVPDGWTYTPFKVKKLNMVKLENPKGDPNRTVLQVHGGGYIVPLNNDYKNLAVRQSVVANAKDTYLVDYRIAPKNPYPAALNDMVTAYKTILKRGTNPKELILFGDSAGGNLALALALELKKQNLPQPGLLVLPSPWTTMETQSPSCQDNVKKDLSLGEINKGMLHEINNPSYAPKGMALNDVRLSPLYGDLTGLPPMLIQAGGYELFLDDCTKLTDKAVKDGVKVTLTVYPGMSHDFAMLLPQLQDSLDAYREMQAYINLNMAN